MNKIIKIPKAILFDLDDTISSYDSVCAPAWQRCCEEFVQKYSTVYTTSELLGSIDHTRDWYWADPVRSKDGRNNLKEARREVVRYSLEALGVKNEEMAVDLADHYTELQYAMISLLPGAREALGMIKEMGIRMAVVTNGTSAGQRGKLERFEITHYFEKLFIDTEVGYSKPDKEIFQYALDQLGLEPEEVWMVGDNLIWDIYGAQQLGIYAVWNDYRKKGLPDNPKIVPDLTVSSIFEMAQRIKKISQQ
jgi:putative hydrolase of the HAD superfamily